MTPKQDFLKRARQTDQEKRRETPIFDVPNEKVDITKDPTDIYGDHFHELQKLIQPRRKFKQKICI